MTRAIGWVGTLGAALLSGAAGPAPAPPAADLAWAYPEGSSPAPAGGFDRTRRLSLYPGAPTFTEAQTHDRLHAVDWRPRSHPAMPRIVAEGRAPDVPACGFCHLPAGEGRPENASLAGLPRDYIVAQVRQFASGARTSVVHGWSPSALMSTLAEHTTPAEAASAADYFSRLPFTSHVRVIETAATPEPAAWNFIFVTGAGKPVRPLGQRIVEGPSSRERWERRDPLIAYTAYVPPGSLKRGEALARGPGGSQACADCHGAGLKGGGLGPPLAGRSPSYLFRQLYAFKAAARTGGDAALMQAVTARMSTSDMIALSAWAGSRKP